MRYRIQVTSRFFNGAIEKANTWREARDIFENIWKQVGPPSGANPHLLYRGQADSRWPLSSTLDRSTAVSKTAEAYHEAICIRVRPPLSVLSDRDWSKVRPEAAFSNADLFTYRHFPDIESYRYMIHLRHHGFPSPLLDWSRSGYIAAFFAFREKESAQVPYRSIWLYHESHLGKERDISQPNIKRLDRNILAHRRHIQQQAEYTICTQFNEHRKHQYIPHQAVFDSATPDSEDMLMRIDIPSSERGTVLAGLDAHNLNAYSLFETEEGLMETLAYRELEGR